MAAQRTSVIVGWMVLRGLELPAARRRVEWAGALAMVMFVGVGWGLGWLPAVAHGAAAAVFTLAACCVLRA